MCVRVCVCARASSLCGRASMGPSDRSRGGSCHGNRGRRLVPQDLSCPRILQTSLFSRLSLAFLGLFLLPPPQLLFLPPPPLSLFLSLSLPPAILYIPLSQPLAPFPCILQFPSPPPPPPLPHSSSPPQL